MKYKMSLLIGQWYFFEAILCQNVLYVYEASKSNATSCDSKEMFKKVGAMICDLQTDKSCMFPQITSTDLDLDGIHDVYVYFRKYVDFGFCHPRF